MRIVALINGSLISENSAIYAIYYAKELQLNVELLHLENIKDNIDDVNRSFANLEKIAQELGVEITLILLQNDMDKLRQYVEIHDIDTIFSSSKKNKSIWEKSFSKTLVNMNLKVDLAIVRILKIGRTASVDSIVLPIRGSRLSVKKFSFFATMVKAYNAKSEIYSLDRVSQLHASDIDAPIRKTRLKEIMVNLRHYTRLSKLSNFKFNIKHDYAFKNDEKVLTHIARLHYDLAIIGTHHKYPFIFSQHPIDILFEKTIINTIYFLPFKSAEV